MSGTSTEHPFHIVVGFDFSELSRLALAEALGLASLNPKTALHVIGVLDANHGLGPVEPEGKVNFDEAQRVQQEIMKVVEAKADKYRPANFRFFIHARIGTPAEEILAVASETNADLIVVGTHGRKGVQRLLMGSVAERVMRAAGCPVLVMRPKSTTTTDTENADVPAPEAACSDCVTRRNETDGAQWWCDTHGKPYVQPHRYSYSGGFERTRGDDWSVFNP